MKNITLQNGGRLAAVLACLGLGLAGRAQADCGIAANRFTVLPRVSVASMPEGMSVKKDIAAPAAFDPGDVSNGDPSIVGLWKTTFTSGGQVVDEGFDLWNSDGTEVLNDDPPPQTGNVCLGLFVKSALSTYKLKHPSWTYDANGNLTGTAIIRELIFMGPGGDTYHGTFTIDLFDLDGKHLTQFGGTISATRITVDF